MLGLADTLSCRVMKGDEEVATALRELVSAVIAHPAEMQESQLKVKGRFAELTGAPALFPHQTIPPRDQIAHLLVALPRGLGPCFRRERDAEASIGVQACFGRP